jgi:thiol-disulfide isomerase/thioredoxin
MTILRTALLAIVFASVAPFGATAEIIGQPIKRIATEDQMKASLLQVELIDEGGKRLELARLLANGKPTLVTLWAHWCPNCRAEMGGLKALASKCPDRWNVVFVSSRASDYAKDLSKFKAYHLPWKLYNVSPQMMSSPAKYEVLRAFSGATPDGSISTPLHYLISATGVVQAIVNARMDFAASERARAFCAD